MKNELYKKVYSELKELEDIPRLAQEHHLDEELLFVIYTHRTVRDATKRHYKIVRMMPKQVRLWKNGRSIYSISKELEYPPVLTGFLIFKEAGYPKKDFWKYVRDPNTSPNKRIKAEMKEIVDHDIIYSPFGNEIQTARGIEGELRLQRWLDDKGIEYRTEEELRLIPATARRQRGNYRESLTASKLK